MGFWHCGSPHYTFKPPKSSRQTLSFSHQFLTTKIRGERVKTIRSCGGPQIRGPKVKTIENCGSLGVPNGMSPPSAPGDRFLAPWAPWEQVTSGPRKAVRCSRANFRRSEMSPFTSMGWRGKGLHQHSLRNRVSYGVIPINFLLTVPESSEFLATAPR